MNVLFLDVDGVLNNNASVERQQGFKVCPFLVDILKTIVDATGVQIVLSSSWRLYDDYTADLRAGLQEKGLDIIDKTIELPRNSPHRDRSAEILEWLSRHPEVVNFAIVDDDSDAKIEGHFFQTVFAEGLTVELAEQIINHFKS